MHTLLRGANHFWTPWWRCGWLECMHAPTSAQALIRTRGYAHQQPCAPTFMRTRGYARMHARTKALLCTCAHSPPCTGVSASIRTRVLADMRTLMCTSVHTHTCRTSSNEGEAPETGKPRINYHTVVASSNNLGNQPATRFVTKVCMYPEHEKNTRYAQTRNHAAWEAPSGIPHTLTMYANSHQCNGTGSPVGRGA